MNMMVIQIVVEALEIGPKGQEKRYGKLEIKERIETIQTIALLK